MAAEKKVVVVLDALGTRGIWLRRQPEVVLNEYCQIIDKVRELKGTIEKNFSIFTGTVKEIMDTIIFSDTLILSFNVSDDLQTISYVTWVTSNVLLEGLRRNLFFRGAVSIGDIYYKRDYPVIVGPAIDEVTDWYEKSDWIGIHAAPSMYYLLEKNSKNNILNGMDFFLKYKFPIKDYTNYYGWAMNWPLLLYYLELNKKVYAEEFSSVQESITKIVSRTIEPNYRSDSRKAIEAIDEWINGVFSNSSTGHKDFQKIQNTLEFYRYSVSRIANRRGLQ